MVTEMGKRKSAVLLSAFALLAVLAAVILYALVNGREPERSGQADTEIRKTIVQVNREGMSGSGVVWRKEADRVIVLTAAHVAATGQQTFVVFSDGSVMPAEVLYLSEEFDLAFLEVSTDGMEGKEQGYLAAGWDREIFDAMENGASIHAAGYSGGEYKEIGGLVLDMWIYLEDFQAYMMYARFDEAQAGMSGGGVYDSEMRLTGILCGATPQGETAVLPLSIILSEWSLIG